MVTEIKNKSNTGKFILWGFIAFTFLILFIGISLVRNIFDNGSSSSNNSIGSTIQNSQQAETPKIYSLGDSIQAGDFTWKITKVTTASQVGEEIYGTLMGEKANGIFLILDVEVFNTGNSAQYLMDSFVKLVDKQGREFSSSTSAVFYLKPQGSALMFEQINPGITKKGKIVYDVPKDLKSFDLRISSNLLSDSFSSLKMVI